MFEDVKVTCDVKGCNERFKHTHCPNCKEPVSTESHYMGSVVCYECNTTMNLFGQELRPANEWEEDY